MTEFEMESSASESESDEEVHNNIVIHLLIYYKHYLY